MLLCSPGKFFSELGSFLAPEMVDFLYTKD